MLKVAKDQPTLVAYAVLATLNSVQVAAISIPTWLHVVIIAVSAGVTAFVNQSLVVPVAKVSK